MGRLRDVGRLHGVGRRVIGRLGGIDRGIAFHAVQ
jgi:hypothetical protein